MARNEDIERLIAERERNRPSIGAHDPRFRPLDGQRTTVPAWIASKMPSGATRDLVRVATHGLGQAGTTLLRFLDIPNRVFGNTRSRLQDIYESAERNMARDEFEDKSGVPQTGATVVHLASMGVAGRALPAVFGANVGADTYEMAKYAGAPEGEALAKGVGHGVVDTAIWTLGQGLAFKYLPEAWQWLGRVITGAGRGAASSVTSDAVLNSLGADIPPEEMAKRAVHAAWMVPLLGMLKMGGKRREEAMSLLRKARPDLAGEKADRVIETIEAEFADPRSQKVALAWVARKGANLPDDTAQIKQALEVSSKVKGLDPMSRSPFEILSSPAYARYLPKPRPQDVKAFSNMKRYPMGVIGFDVSDDAAGRQATREMINAYMSPSSNPWCLATGSGAAKLGGLGPGAESYWKQHSAVPKQIFFQEVDGKLELTAFRATSRGGEGQQEYWDTSDAGYSGIPLKVKVPGDPVGRYRKMVFRPDKTAPDRIKLSSDSMRSYNTEQLRARIAEERAELEELQRNGSDERARANVQERLQNAEQKLSELEGRDKNTVPGTFEDIAPGKVFKGDPFRDGRSQTWVRKDSRLRELDALGREADDLGEDTADIERAYNEEESRLAEPGRPDDYVLVEDKVRTTKNGITKFRTTKYADPTDPDLGLYEGDENLKVGQPVEIEESELVSPEWMRAHGYVPESESDVRRMQRELDIQAWGNGMEAAMAVVPTKRTYMQTKSGAPETVTYGPNGRDVVSVDFEENGVPYREEYFHSGPVDEYVPGILGDRATLDIRGLPTSSRDYLGNNEPNGFRLTRNPDGESPEVLDEIKWNDGLGGFVRTSGGRRWRTAGLLGADGISDPEARRRVQAVETELAARLARFNSTNPPDLGPVSSMGPIIVDGREVLSAQRAANAVAWTRTHHSFSENEVFPLYYGLRTEAPHWLPQREGWPSASDIATATETPRIIVEDRQPDGTWVPVPGAAMPPAGARGSDQLPPPPTEIPLRRPAADFDDRLGAQAEADANDVPFALKAGRTRRNVRAAEGGGDTPGASETAVSETPVSEAPRNPGGPRIVLNPQVFKDKRDALCVTFNEAFRVVMEMNGFEPVSEPTEKQRKFFADTAYSNDELQLRRTILARIATLDTSVSDPTDEQLEETVEMLEMVMEVGAPQNEWEQQAVQRLHDVVAKSLESTRANGAARQPEPPKDEASTQADVGGGITDEEWKDGDVRYVEKDGSYYRQTYKQGETSASSGWRGEVVQKDEWEAAQKKLQNGGVPVLGDDPMKQATDSALVGLANMESDKPAEPQARPGDLIDFAKTYEPQKLVNPDEPAEPQARPGDLIDFAKTYKPQKLIKPEPGAEGTSSSNWANGAVVGKNDASKFGEPEKPGAEGTSSSNWANGAVVGKNNPEAFGRIEHSWANGQDVSGFRDNPGAFGTEAPGIRGVAMPKPVEMPKLNWQGLASRTDARGRYFDNDGRVITKRQAERMERKKRKDLGLA